MKEFRSAIILTLAFVVLTGGAFPVLIWGLGQLFFPYQSNGSLVYASDKLIGSSIIGQQFALPKYFHPRPSAAGNGYDAANSSGTNLGPTSAKLFNGVVDDPATADVDESYTGVAQLAKTYREENGLAADFPIPVDAVTRSASGLDPHISPKNAQLQAGRIGKERNLSEGKVRSLIEANTQQRFLGIFGDPRVNVLALNMSLDKAS